MSAQERGRLLEMVVVPRSAKLEAVELDLKLALVAVVAGTRPPVSPAMVRAYLTTHLGIGGVSASVRRHDLEDFVVRFSRREDLEVVLRTPVHGAPFSLIWRPWRRTSLASAGSFHFRVLVGMRRVPLHARSVAVAQTILGSACARVVLAPPDVAPADDDREFFVAAWCLHPRFIPDEKIIFIPEPNVCVAGEAFYLHADEIVHDKLPGLRYLVRLRIVEYQDWSTPPLSGDDEGYDGGDKDDQRSLLG